MKKMVHLALATSLVTAGHAAVLTDGASAKTADQQFQPSTTGQATSAGQTEKQSDTKQYLVKFRSQGKKAAKAASFSHEIQQAGGKIIKTFELIPEYISVSLDAKAAAKLERHPQVEQIMLDEPEEQVPFFDPTKPDWGTDAMRLRTFWQAGYTGKGVEIAAADTGLNDHPAINTDEIKHVLISPLATNRYDWPLYSHGTATIGVMAMIADNVAPNYPDRVYGASYGANFTNLKIHSDDAKLTVTDVISGLEYCLNNGIDIVTFNISLKEYNSALEAAVIRAYQSGLTMVAAAGNYADPAKPRPGWDGGLVWPARYTATVSVGAVSPELTRVVYSSYGPQLDFVAPTDTIAPVTYDGVPTYEPFGGTSNAVANAAGAFGLLKSAYPHYPASLLVKKMKEQALDLGAAGRDDEYGSGLVQLTSEMLPVVPVIEETTVLHGTDFYGDWSYAGANLIGEPILESGGISDNGVTSTAAMFEVKDGAVLSFDYELATESGADFLEVYLDGSLILRTSGDVSKTAAPARELTAGKHTLEFRYLKDESIDAPTDKVWIHQVKVSY
ncbi:S8 family serine peptidase [Brevibacillus dissolubilis]|uniref:S8 family serine peptidase n=1 Tax=Brevibacillus dissolubilis TaxID=1844116 RepID=UPI001116BE5B|nr:S8 family serine peptidase [Brevibacillus dissolubilis]